MDTSFSWLKNFVKCFSSPQQKFHWIRLKQLCNWTKIITLCPRLKENVINPNHFEKMNTALSVTLLNHDVAAAILYYVGTKRLEAKHQTTAWFITYYYA
jgi:hypothetical protein